MATHPPHNTALLRTACAIFRASCSFCFRLLLIEAAGCNSSSRLIPICPGVNPGSLCTCSKLVGLGEGLVGTISWSPLAQLSAMTVLDISDNTNVTGPLGSQLAPRLKQVNFGALPGMQLAYHLVHSVGAADCCVQG